MIRAIRKSCHSVTHRLRTCITAGRAKGSLVAVGEAIYTIGIITLDHSLDILFVPVYPCGTVLMLNFPKMGRLKEPYATALAKATMS